MSPTTKACTLRHSGKQAPKPAQQHPTVEAVQNAVESLNDQLKALHQHVVYGF